MHRIRTQRTFEVFFILKIFVWKKSMCISRSSKFYHDEHFYFFNLIFIVIQVNDNIKEFLEIQSVWNVNVCCQFTPKRHGKTSTNFFCEAYEKYFETKVDNLEKAWVPDCICISCATTLSKWLLGKRIRFSISTPMIWKELKDHVTDCYFCLTTTFGH